MTLRILHFSDIHVSVPTAQLLLRDFIGPRPKRLLGLANLLLRRGKHFAETAIKLEALARIAQEEKIDFALCTGDYTALGTDIELRAARKAVEAFVSAPLGFATVPGNHDLYLNDAIHERRFERYFEEFLRSDCPEYSVDGPWPLVRWVGEDVVIVAVNSARPRPQLLLSNGRIPDVQIDALQGIFADPRVQSRFVIVATHYAARLENGQPDSQRHGLENGEALIEACRPLRRGAIVHGHVHRRYWVKIPELRIPLLGAGSAIHHGREGFWLFDIGRDEASVRAGSWSPEERRYVLAPPLQTPFV